ncbi:Endonuclease III-like protein [Cladosporium halotolerans]|uniref:Endonuclease III homolog n=1 Tax=Cladosporium halotolerans TaxID=1052096 RepID=A0AB34KKC1_9PEZI
MRTSRVSRETARLVDALTPTASGGGSLRRSLRGLRHTDSSAENSTQRPSDSGSELSTPPSSPDSTASDFDAGASLGKRKRRAAATTSTTESKTTTPRRTPRKAPKLEEQDEGEKKFKKGRRQPAKHIKGPNGELQSEPPANWEKMYSITAEMRKRVLAPVDTMGCESLAEEQRSPLDRRLQTLIALMLSSQTKDTVTAVAMKNLQDNLPGGFNLAALLTVEPERLNELIGKVGFHNNKTKYIKQVAPILRDKFGGDIPDTIEGLTSLPGVGPKMAYLCMSAGWGRDEGIGVDVHVHRITNLWGWHKTSTPEQTRMELESWLPKEKWHDINHLLVGFGQTICLPVGRKCGECDLSGTGLCPSAVKSSPVKKKVKKMEVEVDNGEVKKEDIKIENDDVGIKVEADIEGEGKVELQSIAGAPLSGEDSKTS